MKTLITIGFLLAALGCYLLGFVIPGGLFLFLGIAFELGFWFRVSKAFKGKTNNSLANQKNS